MIVVEPRTGYERVFDAMTEWGIRICSGVTGGGLVHLLKHIDPYAVQRARREALEFFTVGYRGLRISKSQRRFWIDDGTVWQRVDEAGVLRGQAALFKT
jgi:hypothetical protein